MGRHIVRSFVIVLEIVGVLWNESIKEFLQVAARSWCGIFHDDQAAAGVLSKDRDRAVPNLMFVDEGPDIASDFVGSFPFGSNF